jgi:hypothetical protein
LVQETKHEILTFYDPENNTLGISHRLCKWCGLPHESNARATHINCHVTCINDDFPSVSGL